MELVEGPTLADRIAERGDPAGRGAADRQADRRGARSGTRAGHHPSRSQARQHQDQGRRHRQGAGLRSRQGARPGRCQRAATLPNSPTLSMQATAAGVILGTAAYMAPEQARGKAVDKRADIWAFGCVLFEMLTAQRAFQGDDVTDTIVAVVSKEPDWTALPASASGVRPLLARCLKKDREATRAGDRRRANPNRRVDQRQIRRSDGDPRDCGDAVRRATPRSIAALAVVAATAALVTWAVTRPAPPAPCSCRDSRLCRRRHSL